MYKKLLLTKHWRLTFLFAESPSETFPHSGFVFGVVGDHRNCCPVCVQAAAPPNTRIVEQAHEGETDLLPVPMTMLPALERVWPGNREPRLESLLLSRRSSSKLSQSATYQLNIEYL